jgi:hypothetical protein
MFFVGHGTHTPENCPGRSKEGAQCSLTSGLNARKPQKKSQDSWGAYVGATEHVNYIMVQAKDYQSMLEFFVPLIFTQQGTINPVTTMDERTKFIQPGD